MRVGVFDQHHVELLDSVETPLGHLSRLFKQHGKMVKDLNVRASLGQFGLGGRKATQKIRTLSGGEKARYTVFVKPLYCVSGQFVNIRFWFFPSCLLPMSFSPICLPQLSLLPPVSFFVGMGYYLIGWVLRRRWAGSSLLVWWSPHPKSCCWTNRRTTW